MKANGLVLVVLFSLVGLPALATSLAAVGVLNSASEVSGMPEGSQAYSGSTYGFGALLSTGDVLEFELGALYVGRRISARNASFSVLEVPAVFRLTPFPYVSFSAGGYGSRALGDVSVGDSHYTFDEMQFARNELGIMAGASFDLPIVPSVSFTADLRYLYGLSHLLDGEVENYYFRGIQLLAGLRVGL